MVGTSPGYWGRGQQTMAQSRPWLAFVNKVLLEHSMLIGLCKTYSCVRAVMTRLRSCDRYHMACKAENVY